MTSGSRARGPSVVPPPLATVLFEPFRKLDAVAPCPETPPSVPLLCPAGLGVPAPRSTSPDGPGSASAPTGPLLPGGRPGRLALAAVVTPVRCHAGPLWVDCKPPHTPDPSRGLVPSAVCPSSWQPRPRPASAALGSSVPRLCVGLHRREAGQVRPWLHGVNDTGRRGVLASGPGLGIRPPRGLRWGLVAWAACGLGAVGVRHGGPPRSLSRCVLACSCLRSPVPGRLQTPRQQPDPAPETRGEACTAARPDLPEAQGGEVEVGGPGRLHVACVSVGGAEMWWPPAFRRCESGPAGGEPLRSRLSLDRACPILKGAVPFGFLLALPSSRQSSRSAVATRKGRPRTARGVRPSGALRRCSRAVRTAPCRFPSPSGKLLAETPSVSLKLTLKAEPCLPVGGRAAGRRPVVIASESLALPEIGFSMLYCFFPTAFRFVSSTDLCGLGGII